MYTKRASDVAEIQNRSGTYYVLETDKYISPEYREHLTNLNAKGIEYGDSMIWTNSEYVYDELRQAIFRQTVGKKGNMADAIRRAINRQLRRRAWEEDGVSWIMYMDWENKY